MKKEKLVKTCCVKNCGISAKNEGVTFFSYPNFNTHQRTLWTQVLTNINGETWKPGLFSEICNAHFVSGKVHPNPMHIDYAPTIFTPTINKPDRRFDAISVQQFGLEYIKHEVLLEKPIRENMTEERKAAYHRVRMTLGITYAKVLAWEKRLRQLIEHRMLARTRYGPRSNKDAPAWMKVVEAKLQTVRDFNNARPVKIGRHVTPGGVINVLCAAAAARGMLCSTELYNHVRRSLRLCTTTNALHAVWVSAQRVSLEHVAVSGRAGDWGGAAPPPDVARVADLVLLHTDVDMHRLLSDESLFRYQEAKALELLWELVQRHNLEEEMSKKMRAQRWTRAHKEYLDSGRRVSLVVLQRRWHELKLQAWDRLESYWKHTRGSVTPTPTPTTIDPPTGTDPQPTDTPEDIPLPLPAPIHLEILRKCPHVALEPIICWRKQAATGLVIAQPLDETEEPTTRPSRSRNRTRNGSVTSDADFSDDSSDNSSNGDPSNRKAAKIHSRPQMKRKQADNSGDTDVPIKKRTISESSSEHELVIDEASNNGHSIIKPEQNQHADTNSIDTVSKRVADKTIAAMERLDPKQLSSEIRLESGSTEAEEKRRSSMENKVQIALNNTGDDEPSLPFDVDMNEPSDVTDEDIDDEGEDPGIDLKLLMEPRVDLVQVDPKILIKNEELAPSIPKTNRSQSSHNNSRKTDKYSTKYQYSKVENTSIEDVARNIANVVYKKMVKKLLDPIGGDAVDNDSDVEFDDTYMHIALNDIKKETQFFNITDTEHPIFASDTKKPQIIKENVNIKKEMVYEDDGAYNSADITNIDMKKEAYSEQNGLRELKTNDCLYSDSSNDDLGTGYTKIRSANSPSSEWSVNFDSVAEEANRVPKKEFLEIEEIRRDPVISAPGQLEGTMINGYTTDKSTTDKTKYGLPADRLEAVLQELSNATPARRGPPTTHCCAALLHLTVNDDRRRKGLTEIPLHTIHEDGVCNCCCSHLCDKLSRISLNAQIQALEEDVIKMVKNSMDFLVKKGNNLKQQNPTASDTPGTESTLTKEPEKKIIALPLKKRALSLQLDEVKDNLTASKTVTEVSKPNPKPCPKSKKPAGGDQTIHASTPTPTPASNQAISSSETRPNSESSKSKNSSGSSKRQKSKSSSKTDHSSTSLSNGHNSASSSSKNNHNSDSSKNDDNSGSPSNEPNSSNLSKSRNYSTTSLTTDSGPSKSHNNSTSQSEGKHKSSSKTKKKISSKKLKQKSTPPTPNLQPNPPKVEINSNERVSILPKIQEDESYKEWIRQKNLTARYFSIGKGVVEEPEYTGWGSKNSFNSLKSTKEVKTVDTPKPDPPVTPRIHVIITPKTTTHSAETPVEGEKSNDIPNMPINKDIAPKITEKVESTKPSNKELTDGELLLNNLEETFRSMSPDPIQDKLKVRTAPKMTTLNEIKSKLDTKTDLDKPAVSSITVKKRARRNFTTFSVLKPETKSVTTKNSTNQTSNIFNNFKPNTKHLKEPVTQVNREVKATTIHKRPVAFTDLKPSTNRPESGMTVTKIPQSTIRVWNNLKLNGKEQKSSKCTILEDITITPTKPTVTDTVDLTADDTPQLNSQLTYPELQPDLNSVRATINQLSAWIKMVEKPIMAKKAKIDSVTTQTPVKPMTPTEVKPTVRAEPVKPPTPVPKSTPLRLNIEDLTYDNLTEKSERRTLNKQKTSNNLVDSHTQTDPTIQLSNGSILPNENVNFVSNTPSWISQLKSSMTFDRVNQPNVIQMPPVNQTASNPNLMLSPPMYAPQNGGNMVPPYFRMAPQSAGLPNYIRMMPKENNFNPPMIYIGNNNFNFVPHENPQIIYDDDPYQPCSMPENVPTNLLPYPNLTTNPMGYVQPNSHIHNYSMPTPQMNQEFPPDVVQNSPVLTLQVQPGPQHFGNQVSPYYGEGNNGVMEQLSNSEYVSPDAKVGRFSMQMPGPEGPQTTIIMAITLPPGNNGVGAPQAQPEHEPQTDVPASGATAPIAATLITPIAIASAPTPDISSAPDVTSATPATDEVQPEQCHRPRAVVLGGPRPGRPSIRLNTIGKRNRKAIAQYVNVEEFQELLIKARSTAKKEKYFYKTDAKQLTPSQLPYSCTVICVDGVRPPLGILEDPVDQYNLTWYTVVTDARLDQVAPTYWTISSFEETYRVVYFEDDEMKDDCGGNDRDEKIYEGRLRGHAMGSNPSTSKAKDKDVIGNATGSYKILSAVVTPEELRYLALGGYNLSVLDVRRGSWSPLQIEKYHEEDSDYDDNENNKKDYTFTSDICPPCVLKTMADLLNQKTLRRSARFACKNLRN